MSWKELFEIEIQRPESDEADDEKDCLCPADAIGQWSGLLQVTRIRKEDTAGLCASLSFS